MEKINKYLTNLKDYRKGWKNRRVDENQKVNNQFKLTADIIALTANGLTFLINDRDWPDG